MDNFNFYSPTEFVFGKDRENECGELVKKYGGTKVLIHYGGGSAVRSGLIDRVKASLDAAGIAHVELGGVKPNPRDTLIYKGIEMVRANGVDFILAVDVERVQDAGCAAVARGQQSERREAEWLPAKLMNILADNTAAMQSYHCLMWIRL